MLNMLKLDWIGMKTYQKLFIFVPLGTCFLGFTSELMIIPFSVVYMIIYSCNPFAVEEKGKLDNLYLTLPVRRSTIVSARYSLSIMMQFVGIAMGIILTILISSFFYGRKIFYERTFQASFPIIAILVSGSILLGAILNLSTFPILFRLGYAKGKLFGFFIPIFGSCGLAYIIYLLQLFNEALRLRFHSAVKWMTANTLWSALIMLAIAALIYILSYQLSQKIYDRREF